MEGDLISQHHQYEFRDFVMGSGTPCVVEGVEGLLSMPNVESSDISNPHGHGMFKRPDRLMGKSVIATVKFNTSAGGIDALLRKVRRSFQSTEEEYPFVFWRPGEAKKRVYVRCRRREIPTSYELAHGGGEMNVQLDATDPRIYSNDEQVEVLTITPGESQVSFTLWHGGDFEYGTYPIIEIEGSALNPTIANDDDDNKQALIQYDVNAGNILTLDFKNKTIQHNGVNVYGPNVWWPGSRWWKLVPGDNKITVIRANTDGTATIRIRWRDAFA